ncbi:MAG TPA: hypothetical protein VGF34_05840 [Stellaceae bacterium]|jgi:hypothetical protein
MELGDRRVRQAFRERPAFRQWNETGRATGGNWPASRWRRPVNRPRRIARLVFRAAAIAGLVMLGVAAIAFNVKAAGGNARDVVAGLLVPVVLGLLAAAVVAELRLHRKGH